MDLGGPGDYLVGCQGKEVPIVSDRNRPILAIIVATALVLPGPAAAQDGIAGSYLAARIAAGDNDYRAAAQYFSAALVRDPGNVSLMENAMLSQIGLGDIDAAAPIAARLVASGQANQIARIVQLAVDIRNRDHAAAQAALGGTEGIGPLIDGLVSAWLELAQGRFSEAQEAFDSIAAGPGLEAFALYHKALALASVGDFEGADAIFSGTADGPLPVTRRGVIAHAQILSQLERNAAARDLIAQTFGADADPEFAALTRRLEAGETLDYDVVRTADEGLAEVFFTVAGVLNGESPDGFTLVFARVADYLRPGDVDGLLLIAGILESQGQYGLATEVYERVPTDHPSFHAAEIGRADALAASGRTEAAIEALQQLARSQGDIPAVHQALGDMLRRESRFDEAARAYGRAIDLLGTPQVAHWPIYYTRGITHEREGRWDEAEADFRQALALQPEQPQVLNYLGYSFVDKGENLVEALDMIERAVAARPDDGYITDSLAWAFYKLGRYDEAVEPMERAAELVPTDPIITDHLGDVYWAVGRKLEAQFQWRRALSFEPEEKEAQRIRRKLEVGLDAVLEEEGAPPLRAADAAAADN